MIDYCKLLGRKEVEFDLVGLDESLAGKHVLVTGAGGSIGSEICRKLMGYDFAILFPVCKSEASLMNLLSGFSSGHLNSVCSFIGDVTDAGRMEFIFSTAKPDLVIHCAAHKHVPLMEANPGEAIKNNVFGTMVVAEACARHKSQMVLVSTDKASNPTSVMGATKRLAEKCVLRSSNGRDGFCVARLINVIGSSGSVLEIWQRQLAAGERLTVTHPEMTRYFMTVREAATLILKAASLATGLERFVFDMDEPTKIVDLAKRFQEMHGVQREIHVTGIRPGEKLHEDSPCADAPHLASPGIRYNTFSYQEDYLSRLNRAVNAPAPDAIAALRECLPEYKTERQCQTLSQAV